MRGFNVKVASQEACVCVWSVGVQGAVLVGVPSCEYHDDSLLTPSQVILGSERLGGTLRPEGAVAQVKGTGQVRGRLWHKSKIFWVRN